jgi:type IV secretory pathway VirJ component
VSPKPGARAVLALFLAACCLVPAAQGASARAASSAAGAAMTFGRFGTVTVYDPPARPSRVVLFVSGDGGWNLGVVDMARRIAATGALVVGIDIRSYLRRLEASTESCVYPGADFEALSQFVQHDRELPSYITPGLVGYSSGATLVYAVLAESPPNTFRGAISMGFCPDPQLVKPMCPGNGLAWTSGPKGKGVIFLPAKTLEVPWIALQGASDQVCDSDSTASFVRQVPHASLMLLPKVGHGFSVPRRWAPELEQALRRLDHVSDPTERAGLEPGRGNQGVGDLPLVEVAASGPRSAAMAVLLTGDGGWGVTDRGIARSLAERGVPAVGLNSLRYFWHARTPETAASDLERILRHYRDAWNRDQFILIGYSLGADVLPFMASRLPAELLDRVRALVLIGPSHDVDFKFHIGDWLGEFHRKDDRPVLPEVQKLRGRTILCFHGNGEKNSLCSDLEHSLARVYVYPGGHRVGGRFEAIADTILAVAH